MAIYQTHLKDLKLITRGKVRDIYDLGDELLLVATDRVSAFDVILPTPIPGKGEILTKTTAFWLERFKNKVKSHASPTCLQDVVKDPEQLEEIQSQAVIVKKAKPLPVECVVRGYLLGSGFKDYQKTGSVCGVKLPKGLKLASKLEKPIFTPATKAEHGEHDENIDFVKVVKLVGEEVAIQIRDLSLSLYQEAAEYALNRGVIIADTKFEFGLIDGQVTLIDEVLTPDSSRYWNASTYEEGTSPASYDKQIIRDYLETLDWDKTAPGPELPQGIVTLAANRYREIYHILTD